MELINMNDRELVNNLLNSQESITLDFKGTSLQISENYQKAGFIAGDIG